MQYSDTSNKNGIIQLIEQYTGLGDGAISGNSTLLKQITTLVNMSFDEIMPLVLSATGDQIAWDDINQTDLPVGTFNLVSGQNDYLITTDDNSLDILDIKAVRILATATATYYQNVELIDSTDTDALSAIAPNSVETGVPLKALKRGNRLYFWPTPNYNSTAGVKIWFERIPSYFASSDTTKTPGIPRIFHPLLPQIAAYTWLCINKPNNTILIRDLQNKIVEQKRQLHAFSRIRNPTRERITTNRISFR